MYSVIFLLFILTCSITRAYDESNEETKPGIEYVQIFRNIPTVFEYFLDVLERRVEILERDDIGAFQKQPEDECDFTKTKREVEHCLANDNNNVEEKKDNAYDKSEYNQNAERYKRYDSEILTDKYVHEYGRSVPQFPNQSKKNHMITATKDKSNVVKRENIKHAFIDMPLQQHYQNIKRNKNNKKKDFKQKSKRDNAQELDFKGVDWSLFYLSPEEVEEKALRTERIIEEHNQKKEV